MNKEKKTKSNQNDGRAGPRRSGCRLWYCCSSGSGRRGGKPVAVVNAPDLPRSCTLKCPRRRVATAAMCCNRRYALQLTLCGLDTIAAPWRLPHGPAASHHSPCSDASAADARRSTCLRREQRSRATMQQCEVSTKDKAHRHNAALRQHKRTAARQRNRER